MKQQVWRPAAWAIFLIVAAIRPGVDLADRWLAAACWDIPSEWNAVADVAMRTGVVDARVGGVPAPWRQASIIPLEDSKVAVVTISDFFQSRSTFLTEEYDVLGVLARTTSDPALVTDEARGYKPLSHVWPIVKQDGRLQTLIAFAPLRSEPPMLGLFAYVALGAQENDVNEMLLARRLGSAPGPLWGELVRTDVNGDGFDDLLVYPRGDSGNARPLATFTWDPRARSYAIDMTDEDRLIIAWWGSTPAIRATVPRDVAIDDAVQAVAARLDDGRPGQPADDGDKRRPIRGLSRR